MSPHGLLDGIKIRHVYGSLALAVLLVVVIIDVVQGSLLSLMSLRGLALVVILGLLRSSWHLWCLFKTLRRPIAVGFGATRSSWTRWHVSRRLWPRVTSSWPIGPLLLVMVVRPLGSRCWRVLRHSHRALERSKPLPWGRRASPWGHAVGWWPLPPSRALIVSRIVTLHLGLSSPSHGGAPLLDRGRTSTSARRRPHPSALACVVRS